MTDAAGDAPSTGQDSESYCVTSRSRDHASWDDTEGEVGNFDRLRLLAEASILKALVRWGLRLHAEIGAERGCVTALLTTTPCRTLLMTVISTIISQYCTAHASDSMITHGEGDKDYEVRDLKSTKIVCVKQWSGAMSYFGLATCDRPKWSTLEWLRSQVNNAEKFNSPEEFARDLAARLNEKINSLAIQDEKEKGIGIHFTVYEHINGIPIPEFFYITNYADTSYEHLLPEGVRVTRETYNNLTGDGSSPRSRHGEPAYRYEARKRLAAGALLIFNNGDTEMFNIASDAIRRIIQEAKRRNILQPRNDPKAHRDLAMWPIELVAKIQKNFLRYGYQKVGGDLHNLSITPNGIYESETGDDKF